MKTSSRWNIRSMGGKIILGLVLAAMFGSVDVAPSFGDDGRHGRGDRYEHRGRGHDRGDRYEHRGRGHDRGVRYYHDNRGRRYHHVRGRRVYQPYVYTERVYVEPPVYYEPPPPPGISIFLPGLTIRP